MFTVAWLRFDGSVAHTLMRRYGSHDIQRLAVERELWDSNLENV